MDESEVNELTARFILDVFLQQDVSMRDVFDYVSVGGYDVTKRDELATEVWYRVDEVLNAASLNHDLRDLLVAAAQNTREEH